MKYTEIRIFRNYAKRRIDFKSDIN